MSNDAYLRNEWKATAEMVRRNLTSSAEYSNETRRQVLEAKDVATAAQVQVDGLRKEVIHLRTMLAGVMSCGNIS